MISVHTTYICIHYLQDIFKDIILPLMCHSDEDEALWLDDPQEYIRIKYGGLLSVVS